MSDQTNPFLETVAEGSLDELQSAIDRGIAINSQGDRGCTALMVAMEGSDIEKAKLLVQNGADLEIRDEFNRTALGYAVEHDFAEGVELLISLGADRGYQPKYPLKKISYGHLPTRSEMPEAFKSCMSPDDWEQSQQNVHQMLNEMGQNPKVTPEIGNVQSLEVLNHFLRAGDDLNLASTEMKRIFLGLEIAGEFRCTSSEYHKHKSRQFGSDNPTTMDFAFWKEMVRTGVDSYAAQKHFRDDTPFEQRTPVWSFERFGSTLTVLNDGRSVQIGGEHEDYYDPDFCIYNDVVVFDGQGQFQILGYPREIFPPTDFHTATLAHDCIYIIGCLGYIEDRLHGVTPVYKLTLNSWEIEPVQTFGETPGWISRHSSRYIPERHSIVVIPRDVFTSDGELKTLDNAEPIELDLSTFRWQRSRANDF